MCTIRHAVRIFSLAALLAGPVAAQDGGGLILQAQGGGLSTLASLDNNQVWDAGLGAGFGASIGTRVNRVFVARADAMVSSAPIKFTGTDANDDLSRVFVSAVAQIQMPRERLRPYALTGVGATVVNHDSNSDPKQTVGHWLGGAGLSYTLGNSGLSLVAEGRVYLYQVRGLPGTGGGAQRVMTDLGFGAGLSYRL